MKIAIIGAGAMGSIYAGLLKEGGHEVHLVDVWEEHIEAIKQNGLRIAGASGNRIVPSIGAHHSTNTVGICELIIIATKASAVAAAAASISCLIGEMFGGASERVEKLAAVWRKAGFNVRAFEDINQLIWEKFICNVTFSAPCTVFEKTLGELMADSNAWPVALGCTREAYDAAIAHKIQLDFNDPEQYVLEFGENMPDARPSMYLDHLDGRRSEIDAINGMVPLVSKQVGLEAPFNTALTAIVRSREEKFS